MRSAVKPISTCTVLALALGAVVVVSLGTGAVGIPPGRALTIVGDHLGLGRGPGGRDDAVLWQVRMPRVLLAALVGAALGVAGAALQAVFRNPLAEPAVIGVSSGAAAGAVFAIVTGAAFLGTRTVPVAAFVGALTAMLVVYLGARTHGRVEVVTLLLTGVAVSIVASALTGFLTYGATDAQLRDIVFWTLGSLGGATWESVRTIAPIILLGSAVLVAFARSLDLLSLGDREARHLGVRVDRVRLGVIVCAALVTGAAVAVAGIVGFVGLVVPHLLRLTVGPEHRTLLPASALGGACLLVVADLVARTVVVPRELPLGVVTALIGGPFLFWLIHRTRREHGGWA